MDRQRKEEEIKTKSSKKAVDAEQSLLNRVHWEAWNKLNSFIFVIIIFLIVVVFALFRQVVPKKVGT